MRTITSLSILLQLTNRCDAVSLIPRDIHRYASLRPSTTVEVSAPAAIAEIPIDTSTTTTQTARNTITFGTNNTVVQAFEVIVSATPFTATSDIMRNGFVSLAAVCKHYQTLLVTSLLVSSGAFLTNPRNLPNLSSGALQMRKNILTGSIIFTIGDVGAQLLTYLAESSNTERYFTNITVLFQLNQQRLAISTILGVLWAGIANPAVYSMVERILPGSRSLGRVLLKMSMSISILSTFGNYAIMFFRRYLQQLCTVWNMLKTNSSGGVGITSKTIMMLGMELQTRFRACVSSCNHDIKEVLMDDLKVWPLYDFMCFSVIPPTVRPVANAVMASLWSMYMSIASAGTICTPSVSNSVVGDDGDVGTTVTVSRISD